jgi:hypothetical protein
MMASANQRCDIEKLKYMASFGHDGKSIACALGRTPQSVRVKAVEIGVSLCPPKMDHRRIKLSVQAWRALQTEADRLGTSAGRLARLVVETVARDRLFSAVIDAPVPQRKKRADASAPPPPSQSFLNTFAPRLVSTRSVATFWKST